MSAQNIKETLDYICRVFDFLGVTHPSAEEFRQSKFDKGDEAILNKYTFMFQELCFLHLSDFKFRLSEVQRSENDMMTKLPSIKKFIIYYFYQLDCPFLKVEKNVIQMVTSSTRSMLLILGWLMDKIDLFENYTGLLNKETRTLFDISEQNIPIDESDRVYESMPIVKSSVLDENEIVSMFKVLKSKHDSVIKLQKYQGNKLKEIKKMLETEGSDLTLEEYFFLANEENLKAIAVKYESMVKTLDYESANVRHREIFWCWLESVIDLDKKDIANDPDYGFEDEIDISGIVGLDTQSLINMDRLTNNFKEVIEKYQKYREKFSQFQETWIKQSQLFKTEKYAKLAVRFKDALPPVIKELEAKYPSLESISKSKKKGSFLLGEIRAQFERLQNEESEDSLTCSLENLEGMLKEIEDELNQTKLEIEAYLNENFSILSQEIIIYPRPDKADEDTGNQNEEDDQEDQ